MHINLWTKLWSKDAPWLLQDAQRVRLQIYALLDATSAAISRADGSCKMVNMVEDGGLPHSRAGGTEGSGSSLALSQKGNSEAAMTAMPRTGWEEKVGQLAPGIGVQAGRHCACQSRWPDFLHFNPQVAFLSHRTKFSLLVILNPPHSEHISVPLFLIWKVFNWPSDPIAVYVLTNYQPSCSHNVIKLCCLNTYADLCDVQLEAFLPFKLKAFT